MRVDELGRVLAPGGRFLLVDIVSPESPLTDTFLNAVELMRDPSHVRDHSIAQWMAMFGAAGFVPELLGTWPMDLDFESWVKRIGAPPEGVQGLRTMFATAASEVRAELRITEQDDFTITNALFRAIRAAGRC